MLAAAIPFRIALFVCLDFPRFDENDPTVITAGEYVVPIVSRDENDSEGNLVHTTTAYGLVSITQFRCVLTYFNICFCLSQAVHFTAAGVETSV